jgi:hypothetical protein
MLLIAPIGVYHGPLDSSLSRICHRTQFVPDSGQVENELFLQFCAPQKIKLNNCQKYSSILAEASSVQGKYE